MSGVGEVCEMCEMCKMCEMCMYFARVGVGGERGKWMRAFGFGVYKSCGNRGSVRRVSVFGSR